MALAKCAPCNLTLHEGENPHGVDTFIKAPNCQALWSPRHESAMVRYYPCPQIEVDSACGTPGEYSEYSEYSDMEVDSTTATIDSTITAYVYENNRRYHGFREGRYLQPNDNAEQGVPCAPPRPASEHAVLTSQVQTAWRCTTTVSSSRSDAPTRRRSTA